MSSRTEATITALPGRQDGQVHVAILILFIVIAVPAIGVAVVSVTIISGTMAGLGHAESVARKPC
ncbi:MAG: hypothetical protein ACR2Q4_24825 [Geminicoccaceae bacterium]